MYCPNCNAQVEQGATSCEKCNADFGPSSAWRPVAHHTPPRKPTSRVFLAAALWFAVVGPVVPILITIASKTIMSPSALRHSGESSPQIYFVAVLVGGPAAALVGFLFGLVLSSAIRQKETWRFLFPPGPIVVRASILTICITSILLIPQWIAIVFGVSGYVPLLLTFFVAPTLVCGVPFTIWLLRKSDA